MILHIHTKIMLILNKTNYIIVIQILLTILHFMHLISNYGVLPFRKLILSRREQKNK